MGCGFSAEEHRDMSEPYEEEMILKPEESVLSAFLRVDGAIRLAERACPAARLLKAEAWLYSLSTQVEQEEEDLEMIAPAPLSIDQANGGGLWKNPIGNNGAIPGAGPNLLHVHNALQVTDLEDNNVAAGGMGGGGPDWRTEDAAGKVALQLGVATNPSLGAKHEEFLAGLSRGAMDAMRRQLHIEIREGARRRVQSLHTQVRELQKLYGDLDKILGMVFGATYASTLERRLEGELDGARSARDALGAAAESWRAAGALLKAASKGAEQALAAWELLDTTKTPEERVSLGMEARSNAVAALAGVAAARDLLPQVDPPHVTSRHMAAVNHAALYMLTDMAHEYRYKHTTKLLNVFKENTTQLMNWLHETYQNTLQKDLIQAEKICSDIHNKLRAERSRLIRERELNDPQK